MMYSTNDPVGDAERFYAVTPAQAAREEAEQRIRDAFKAYFAGDMGAEVPTVKYVAKSTYLLEAFEEVGDIVTDYVSTDSQCEDTFERLMQGQSTVEQLRAVIVDRYVEREADDLAELILQQEGEACCE